MNLSSGVSRDTLALLPHETDILKGIAILAVLVNHFLNSHTDEVPLGDLSGYANGVIVFFFILSGYGIYASAHREGTISWSRFFLKRFCRIYPLFAAAILLTAYLNGKQFPGIDPFLFLGSPFWFIDAIVFCYFLTPLFIHVIDRLEFRSLLIVYAISIVILGGLTVLFFNIHLPAGFLRYRHLLFSFFLAYAGGMALFRFRAELSKQRILDHTALYGLIFLVFLHLSRTKMSPVLMVAAGITFITVSLLLTGAIQTSGCMKGLRMDALAFAGSISLPVYLFNPVYYQMVSKVTGHQVLGSLVLAIILLPVFFGLCHLVETIVSHVTDRIFRLSLPKTR